MIAEENGDKENKRKQQETPESPSKKNKIEMPEVAAAPVGNANHFNLTRLISIQVLVYNPNYARTLLYFYLR